MTALKWLPKTIDPDHDNINTVTIRIQPKLLSDVYQIHEGVGVSGFSLRKVTPDDVFMVHIYTVMDESQHDHVQKVFQSHHDGFWKQTQYGNVYVSAKNKKSLQYFLKYLQLKFPVIKTRFGVIG